MRLLLACGCGLNEARSHSPHERLNDMKSVCWSGCIALVMVSTVMSAEKTLPLFAFAEPDASKEWQNVNDSVMGGVSEGKFKITDDKTLVFFGTLSLENNGGFASVRTKPKQLGMQRGDALLVRVRGDGREYTLNLYVNRQQVAFSYRAAIPTKKDEWIEVTVPLDKFEATSFGRLVRDAGPVDPKEVNALGFLLSDKTAGRFQLEVEWIKLVRPEEAK
ncbi:MAG: CIA30 family protein [Pirellulaceae bacterium]